MYLQKLLLISSVRNISANYKLSSLKNKNILTKYDWNLKNLVLWKFTSSEWMLSASKSSYLSKTDWLDWDDSTGLVLTLNSKLISNSVTYMLVSRPKKLLIMEIIDRVSSLNKLVSIGKYWFCKDTSGSKQVLKKDCFSSTMPSLNNWTRLSSLKYSHSWVNATGTINLS